MTALPMQPKTGTERDRELAALRDAAWRLASVAEGDGKHASAAQFYAVGVFFDDCISARSVRFRGRATPRPPRNRGELPAV